MDEINETRPGGLPEEGAITSAVANAAAAAAAAGWGGESDRESVVEAINDFAASFDADDDEGMYDVDDNNVAGERANKKKRKGKMKLSNVQLLHHFEIFLGSGLVCKCLGNCLRILEDEVVKTAVASYLVWFERRSKIDQDNIILQWMIYGHTPGGRPQR